MRRRSLVPVASDNVQNGNWYQFDKHAVAEKIEQNRAPVLVGYERESETRLEPRIQQ